MNAQKYILLLAALAGLLAVALGAFGAHSLEPKLDARSLSNYHTAVYYQFFHALAILAVGILLLHAPSKWFIYSGYAFLAGIILFSGSLYLMATDQVIGLTLPRFVVFLTPLGGLSFIAGWFMLILGILSWK